MAPLLLASLLPDSTGPYLALLIIGFLVGAYGHAAKLRWLVVAGILVILAAVISFQVFASGESAPPGF